MVWGGFSYDGKLDLHFIEGRFTGLRYRDEVVLNRIVPYCNANPDQNLILVQDNAPVHKARVTQEALQQHGVPTMYWPANSPDLNVIEHAWDIIGRAINNHQPPIQNVRQLRQVIIDEWNRIPLATLQNLVQSCRRRCQAVVQNRGAYTTY
jgi:transposase